MEAVAIDSSSKNEHILNLYPATASRLFGVCILLLSLAPLRAQDIHFSQFYNAPLVINPAQTGIFRGDQRFSANFRNQWQAANAPFTTFLGAYDQKLRTKRMDQHFFSAGAHLFYDESGDADLSTFNVSLGGSFTKVLDGINFVSIGAQVGVGARSFDEGFSTDRQYIDGRFEESASTGENFDNSSVAYPDFAVGLNWHGQQPDKRTNFDVGVALYHFHTPGTAFAMEDEVAELPMRLSVLFHPSVQLTDRLDGIVQFMTQVQGTSVETVGGLAARVHLSTARGKELALQAGGAMRLNAISDAFVPSVQVFYQNWRVGLSYDLNISDFNEATNSRGGLELSAQHLITAVKPLRNFKLCPLM